MSDNPGTRALHAFVQGGRDAADHAQALAGLAHVLEIHGSDESFGRLSDAAHKWSQTTARSWQSVFGEMTSRIAGGEDVDQVLKDFTREKP